MNSAREVFREWFSLVDTQPRTILREVYGGIVMYLVSLYVLGAAPIWQAGACPGCTERLNVTSPAGYTDAQFRTLPAAVALAGGISTIFMGLYGNMPIIVAPGISGIYFQQLAVETSPGCAQAASLIVGLFIFAFALMSKKIKIISSTPEDFRLGVAAGKGGLIALIALRNCGLVSPEGTAFVADFNYNVILALLGFAIIIISQQKGFLVFSFIGTIVIISTLSLIIRGATNTTIVGSLQGALPDLSLVAKPPTFDDFSYDNGFFIAQFVIRATFHNLIDIVATVTALVLMSVVRFRFGYDKESFTSVLSESSKCFQIFVSIGLCQVLVSPFLGVSPVTPFIQSTAGIAVGSRTGLSAVVCGSLFMLSALFAAPIASIIPSAATGPVVFVACLPVVQGLKYIDYTNPSRYIPSLMTFFLIFLTYSIGVGVSFGYVVLFTVFIFSPDWTLLTPQMVASFSMCVVLLLSETGLINTLDGLVGVVGGFALFAIVVGLLMMYPFARYFSSTSGLVSHGSVVFHSSAGRSAKPTQNPLPPDGPKPNRPAGSSSPDPEQRSSARESSPPTRVPTEMNEIVVV